MTGRRLTIQERLDELFRRLAAAPRASSADEAFELVRKTLDAVEDQFSGIPKSTNPSMEPGGRLYIPSTEFKRRKADGSIFAQARKHTIHLGIDGSIVIIVT